MAQYSIKELGQLSGIKPHTIRIWEKRHKIVQPKRTSTNIRFYSDDDLKKIINISLLNNSGVKISKLVNLSGDEISKKVVALSEDKGDTAIFIDQLILAMIDLNEEQFEKTISNITLKIGFEKTVVDVVYPFLEKIGVLWHSGMVNPAQEHFISQLIRQKIIVATDNLPVPSKKVSAVLFLPEHELHEIGLLFYNYLVRKAGVLTYYLGQTVPYGDVKYVCTFHRPDIILTSITSYLSPSHVQEYLDKLSLDFPGTRILISGGALKRINLTLKPNARLMEGVKGLQEALSVN